MTRFLHLILSVFYLIQVSVSSKDTPIHRRRDPNAQREYCEFEVFQPSCWKGEVIVMKNASYGRMRLGRCVEANLGHLGCFANVLSAADRMCSGKQTCSISVPNAEFDATKPCYKELKSYLDAIYSCQRVAEDDRGCSLFVASGVQSISLPSVSKFGCGLKSQPWVVEVVTGQRINVTLTDFFRDPDTDGSRLTRGMVVDRLAGKNITVLWDSKERERWIYESKGHILELYISSKEQSMTVTEEQQQHEFLFRFEAVGCADLRAPGDAWIKREGNELTVGCHFTRQTWHLQCQGQRWNGVIGNCTSTQLAAKTGALVNSESSGLPHVLAISTVVGVALTLCLLIVCIGVFVLRRFAKQDRLSDLAKAALQYDNVDSDDEIVQAYYTRTKPERERTSAANDASNAYSHVWELPLPEPADKENPLSTDGRTVSVSTPLTSAPSGDKQDFTAAYNSSATSTRSDETRYFVLDRSASGGANPNSGGMNSVPGINLNATESCRC